MIVDLRSLRLTDVMFDADKLRAAEVPDSIIEAAANCEPDKGFVLIAHRNGEVKEGRPCKLM